jgi:uncharacterized protein (DUF1800 family)
MPHRLRAFLFLVSLFASSVFAQFVITNKPTTVRAMTYYNFTATLNGTAITSGVTWSVNDVSGGNTTVGTFSGFRYNAPTLPPSPNTVTIKAALTADATVTDSATVTVSNPFPNLASVSPSPFPSGTFTLTVNGSEFVPGAVVVMSGVNLPTTYVSSTRLTAQVSLTKSPSFDIRIWVVNPNPGSLNSDVLVIPPVIRTGRSVVSESAARRFLEQAGFGPNTYDVARVQALGFDRWIDEQFTVPASKYPDPSVIGLSNTPVQTRFFTNAVHGRDQLRQRIAFALHKIWVISGVEESTPPQLVPYLQTLSQHAFDNYRTIMERVTLNVGMGEYLDMRNNVKANPTRGTLANENYAREIMQLFTIGLYQLNQDGTHQLDSSSNPIPTYDQHSIMEFARVYTGWTYPTAPGATPRAINPAYYVGEMVPWEANHDTGSKTLLNGVTVPAGQTAEKDLSDALDNIFHHSNVGPFIGKNLIQQLVTSNPSPAYVSRVAAAFANDGAGVRGNMKAVIKAILLDPEARAGDNIVTVNVSAGHYKEPALFLAQTLRGLDAMVNDANTLPTRSNAMGQNVFYPGSVFSYFSPFYLAPNTSGLTGPEFQGDTRTTAVERANQINTLIYGSYGAGSTVDFTRWTTLAATPSALADELGRVFLSGEMPSAYRTEVLSAITGTTTSNLEKARSGLYVVLTSGYYSVNK